MRTEVKTLYKMIDGLQRELGDVRLQTEVMANQIKEQQEQFKSSPLLGNDLTQSEQEELENLERELLDDVEGGTMDQAADIMRRLQSADKPAAFSLIASHDGPLAVDKSIKVESQGRKTELIRV